MTEARVAKIAVAAATYWLDKPYDYLIPEKLRGTLKPGMRVSVPFSRGNRRSEGIVLSLCDSSEYGDKLKPIESALDSEPVLSEKQLKLALWMHDRFFCTVYEAVKTILPTGFWFSADGKRKTNDKRLEMIDLAVPVEEALTIAQNKRRRSPHQAELIELLCQTGRVSAREAMSFTGASRQTLNALIKAELLSVDYEEVFRRPELKYGEVKDLPELNGEQEKVYCGLKSLRSMDSPQAALLFGVTGSGKTAVYIHLIDDVLKAGSSAILLVPEIALTPQMIETFTGYFGDVVAVLHSSLSVAERYDEWKRIKNGSAKLIIGTRSAVFAPCEDLALIIIDEEQEDSYKSENSPRYHARDIAKYRCSKENALLLLGSATPDIESMYAAKQGKYSYFELPNRYNEMLLPTVDIIDMKGELRSGNGGIISTALAIELQKNIEKGQQSILFLNRRGANKLISCSNCGYTYKCPNCSVSLTYHSYNRRLLCHYCGYSKRVDEKCPDCGGELKYIGAGTQLVEEELRQLYPETQVLRMDTDTVKAAGSHDALLEKFRKENIPIMVGTQMVTKGLNFQNVTLVGVLSADQSLYCSDYRSGERTFSLITQVVGRSGRGLLPGRAIIQTYTPENETVKQAAAQDYVSFYDSELQLRRLNFTPPFSDIIAITASGAVEDDVMRCCTDIRNILLASIKNSNTKILGPAPLSVVKVKSRYRYRVSVCGRADGNMRALVSAVIIKCSTSPKYKGISIYADLNPSD